MISNYIKQCNKIVAGNYDKLFLAKINDIASVTFADNVVSAITMETGEPGPKFAYIETDLDTVSFTSNGTAERGYFSEQNLIAKFSEKTTALETALEDFLDAVTCGVVAIRIDGQGRGWISGIAPLDKIAKNRPWMSVVEEFASGESIEDTEEGNRYTITFGRKSATREYELDEELTKSLVETKDADFVEWPA